MTIFFLCFGAGFSNSADRKPACVPQKALCWPYNPQGFLLSRGVAAAETLAPFCKANKALCCYLWERRLGTFLCREETLKGRGSQEASSPSEIRGAFLRDEKRLLAPRPAKAPLESRWGSAGRGAALRRLRCELGSLGSRTPGMGFVLEPADAGGCWAGLCVHKQRRRMRRGGGERGRELSSPPRAPVQLKVSRRVFCTGRQAPHPAWLAVNSFQADRCGGRARGCTKALGLIPW